METQTIEEKIQGRGGKESEVGSERSAQTAMNCIQVCETIKRKCNTYPDSLV